MASKDIGRQPGHGIFKGKAWMGVREEEMTRGCSPGMKGTSTPKACAVAHRNRARGRQLWGWAGGWIGTGEGRG